MQEIGRGLRQYPDKVVRARGLEVDDSLGPNVRALLGSGALRAGLGCEGGGGVGPTRV